MDKWRQTITVDQETKDFWDKVMKSDEKELEELQKDPKFQQFKYGFASFYLKCRELKSSSQVEPDK